jgi:pilus assembly protein CpaB
VVASRPLAAGTKITAADVKLVPWPAKGKVPGSFDKVEDVVDRGVIAAVLPNEPLAETKLAPTKAGAGLPPTIPQGMRAISVRVNEVVGVAGFVTPGTHVDVLVTLKQADANVTRVVVSNVQVLTAGTKLDANKDKPSEAIPSSVVTLLLTPGDAERVVLAANEGQIMLTLRNPLDVEPTTTPGTRVASLFGEAPPPSLPASAAPVRPRVREVAPPPPAAPPPPPPPYSVEAIRGAKRSQETLK